MWLLNHIYACGTIAQDDDVSYTLATTLDERIVDMTINIGLIGKEGIVLATDSRTTWQYGELAYHDDNSQKLRRLTDKIGLMTSGYNRGSIDFLIDYFDRIYVPRMNANIAKLKYDGQLPDDYEFGYLYIVHNFAQAIRNELKPFVENYHAIKAAGGMTFVLAGYDGDTPKIFSVDVNTPTAPFVPRRCEKYHLSGVGGVGKYWVRKLDMVNLDLPADFLKRFAVMIALETIKIDDMCGEPLQLAFVDRNGYNDISEEVDSIKKSVDSEHKWLFEYLRVLKEKA